jgi:T-complex protein 1 subunit theta
MISDLLYAYVIGLVCGEQKNLRDKEGIMTAIRTSVMSKQYGNEDFIAGLIAEACRK